MNARTEPELLSPPMHSPARLSNTHLDALEEEAIFVLREVAAAFEQAYSSAPFVRVTGSDLPEIKHVVWTNFCDVGWRVDESTNRAVVISVIDNLVKGAAGSAIQNFNVMVGIDECAGLK